MRFLVDMPLSPELAAWLVRSGHDAVHAGELGLHRAPDTTIIERARTEHRVVVTADLDFPRILAQIRGAEPGLMLFRGGNYSEKESVERLQRALETVAHEDLLHSIIVIEKHRIRRRSLPIEG
jgi:predicted nuclease of predicted toxin-antitoxin system